MRWRKEEEEKNKRERERREKERERGERREKIEMKCFFFPSFSSGRDPSAKYLVRRRGREGKKE